MPISDKQFHDAIGRLDGKIDTVSDGLNERVREFTKQLGELTGTKHDNQLPGVLLYILGTALILYCGWLGVEVVTQGRQLAVLLAPQKLQAAAANPTNPKNVSQVTKILQDAQKRNQIIEPAVIALAGSRFFEASQPASWSAANDFLDYRSFLNKAYEPKLADIKLMPPNADYDIDFGIDPYQKDHPGAHILRLVTYWAGPPASPEDSARIEKLDKPQTTSSGASYFLVDGKADAILLDGLFLKNVVIRNEEIQYRGGPVRLENVYFVNCTFKLQQTPRSRDLGTALLAAASTKFSATSS